MALVMHMSRAGCLMTRLALWFDPRVVTDHAGGLDMGVVEGQGLFFAVRGRCLILSGSRSAVIDGLTLAADQTIGEEAFRSLSAGGGEDLRGSLEFTAEDPGGRMIESAGFALRIDELQANVKCTLDFTPEWQSRLEPILQTAIPVDLEPPLDGMVMLSANLGITVPELLTRVEQVTQGDSYAGRWWEAVKNPVSDPWISIGPMIARLLQDSGPGIRLTWRNMDYNEVVPMPLLVVLMESTLASLDHVIELSGSNSRSDVNWIQEPTYDSDPGIVSLPMLGGSSIEPSAVIYHGELLVSNSRPMLDAVRQLPSPRDIEPMPHAALWIAARPQDCAQAISEAGILLAECGALRGHDVESFRALSTGWIQQAARIRLVTLATGVVDRQVHVDLDVALAP